MYVVSTCQLRHYTATFRPWPYGRWPKPSAAGHFGHIAAAIWPGFLGPATSPIISTSHLHCSRIRYTRYTRSTVYLSTAILYRAPGDTLPPPNTLSGLRRPTHLCLCSVCGIKGQSFKSSIVCGRSTSWKSSLGAYDKVLFTVRPTACQSIHRNF